MFYEVRNTTDTPHRLQHGSLIQHAILTLQNPMVFDNKFFIIPLCPVADGPATNEALARKDNFQDIIVVILDADFSNCLWRRCVKRTLGERCAKTRRTLRKRCAKRTLGKRCAKRTFGKRCKEFSRIIFRVFMWRN